MKRASVEKLVAAVEAKSGLAKSRLAEIRRRKQALMEAAETNQAEARRLVGDSAEDAADLLAAVRRQAMLEKRAEALRVEAEALEPEIQERRAALKAALREEIAWRRIKRRLQEELRKRRLAQEEERREAVVLQKARYTPLR